MFIILPSSSECKAYLTLAPFTVVSAYIQLTNPFCCVIGFDIIQSLSSRAVISQHLDLTLLYADWTRQEINNLTHSHTSCSAQFISIEGSSLRLGYSRNIPHSVLLVLVLGISCGFTTAQTFPFSKLSKAKKLAAHKVYSFWRIFSPRFLHGD